MLSLTALAFALAAQPAAAATTVEVADAYPDDLLVVQPGVVITDQSGDVNTLHVSYTYETTGGQSPPPGNAVVTVREDSAVLEPGNGCEAAGSKRVRCEVEGIVVIRAVLGGGADTASVEAPAGGVSCACATLSGDDGDDKLTSLDGATLEGGAGNDILTGGPSKAASARDQLDGVNSDILSGGAGDDVLDGGLGRDFLTGGGGDDVLRAGPGEDSLFGGETAGTDDTLPPAGRDELDGGSGSDYLNDSDDDTGEIGPDRVVGGRGVDEVNSYHGRAAGLKVNLSRAGGDGQTGEGDSLVNVEIVFGGSGDDTLIGDGDANQLYGFGGSNTLRGRGGNDALDASSTSRNVLSGDRGNDRITVQAWTTGPVNCGRGRDRVVQPVRGADAPRRPSDRDPGVVVAASCEAIELADGYSFGLDPVPNDAVSGRLLKLDRLPGQGHRDIFSIVITPAEPPYRHLGTGKSTREGVSVRLPTDVARRARRRGIALRAELWESGSKLRMIWRFRVPRR